MDFSFKEEKSKRGILNGKDLNFFYYDIGIADLEGQPIIYDWKTVYSEFKSRLKVDICSSCDNIKIEKKIEKNTIILKKDDNETESMAFFRHLRNAFSHYRIKRIDNFYIMSDINNKGNYTMHGKIETNLLQKFCFKFFDIHNSIVEKQESKC